MVRVSLAAKSMSLFRSVLSSEKPVSGDGYVFSASSAEPVILPGGGFANDARYRQHGDDLVLTGPDGTMVTVQDYFLAVPRPDLQIPEGGRITPALVASFTPPEAAGQLAQVGQVAQAAEPIGQVQDLSGQVFAVRADGTRVQLAAGDAVFQGDVVETVAGGAVNLIFVDRTTFALGSGARLGLDELVYNPATQSGQSSFSVLKGVFVFVSGQIAHADNTQMSVTTPVATIGIRGTTVAGDVRPAGEESRFTVIDGEIAVVTQGGSVVMNQVNTTTSVTSFQVPPSVPVVYTPQQMDASYGEVKTVSRNYFSGGRDTGQNGAGLNDLAPAAGGAGTGSAGAGDATTPAGAVIPAEASFGGGFGGLVDPLPGALTDTVLAVNRAIFEGTNPPIVATATSTENNEVIGTAPNSGGSISEFDLSDFSNAQGAIFFTGSARNDQIIGGAFDDHLDGAGGNDIINGGNGNDTLIGGDGDDTVSGGPGNDTLIAGTGAGNDFYDGGTGNDRLIYSSTTQGFTLNLATGTAIGVEIDQDRFVNMETFVGGSGNDTFLGGAARFFIDGAGGSDILSFANLSAGLTFNVSAGTVIGEGLDAGGSEAGTPVTVTLPVDLIATGSGANWFGLRDIGGLLGLTDAESAGVTGTGDHYDDALAIRVGGQAYAAPASMSQVGNHFTANTQNLAGLDVVVDYKFDDTLPVVRQIVALTNNTGSAISSDVQWINNSGNDSGMQVVGTGSGDLLAGLDDRYIVVSDTATVFSTGSSEVDSFILYGPDNPQVTTSTISLTENEESFGFAGDQGVVAGYNVSVAAGQTIYLMFFAGINGVNTEGLNLAALFDDTSGSAFLDLISDIPGEQLSATVNWSLAGSTNGSFTNIETLVGSGGDDTFVNTGSGVAIFGGDGNDSFTIAGTGFGRLDGGNGFDLINFPGNNQTLDLTSLTGGQLTGIEMIDITGTGNNNLLLDAATALSVTGGINAATSLAHSLIIDGNNGDAVSFQDSWSSAGTATLGESGYTIFSNETNDAQVFVKDDVSVSLA